MNRKQKINYPFNVIDAIIHDRDYPVFDRTLTDFMEDKSFPFYFEYVVQTELDEKKRYILREYFK